MKKENTVTNTDEVVTRAKKGRPVNPMSARQKRLMDIELRRAAGTLKKGRPVNMQSKRQQRMAMQTMQQCVVEQTENTRKVPAKTHQLNLTNTNENA